MIGSFDRFGFARHARGFDAQHLEVDLGGRVCLVTGGNAGIGNATALELARRGATVGLLCRDPGRGEAARDELRPATGSAQVSFDVPDVSDLEAVRRFATQLDAPAVHVLVHNAGVLPDERIVTADGLELTFATHVAGPHLLTRLLAPRLRVVQDARVIWVSSGGMYTQRLDLADVNWVTRRPYDGVKAYAQTKRMQVVLAELWARELAPAVHVYSMHPGWADTRSVQTSLPSFHRLMKRLLRTPDQGADTVVWLAARQPAPEPSGTFWFDREIRSAHYLPWTAERGDDRQALWALAEQVTGGTVV